MDELVVGRIVRFVLDNGPNRGVERPALVIEPERGGKVGLMVFTHCGHPGGDGLASHVWRDAAYDERGAPGTWRWPRTAPVKVETAAPVKVEASEATRPWEGEHSRKKARDRG